MQTTQGSTLQSLRTAEAFLEENADKLADVMTTGARRELRAIIDEISIQVSVQMGSVLVSRGATHRQKALRVTVRDRMAPIARIARAKLLHVPELSALRMPRGKPTIERLSAAAHGMAKAAEVYSSTFIETGLPRDFLARLRSAADALVTSLSERSATIGRQVGATRGLRDKLSEGRKIVGVLDAMITGMLRNEGEPGLLASWRFAKRVRIIGHPGPPLPATTLSS